MDTPYPITRSQDELHYTYLDTFGRPVLVATKNNLVEQHIQDVVVISVILNGVKSLARSLKVPQVQSCPVVLS